MELRATGHAPLADGFALANFISILNQTGSSQRTDVNERRPRTRQKKKKTNGKKKEENRTPKEKRKTRKKNWEGVADTTREGKKVGTIPPVPGLPGRGIYFEGEPGEIATPRTPTQAI